MLPIVHIAFGILLSIILYPIFGFYIIIIFLSSFLIDVDHFLWYGFKYKNWNLKDSYKFYIENTKYKDVLHIFHTIEFLILVILLTLYFRFFLFILIGIGLHYILDAIYTITHKKYGKRAVSLIMWLKRNL